MQMIQLFLEDLETTPEHGSAQDSDAHSTDSNPCIYSHLGNRTKIYTGEKNSTVNRQC